MPSFTRGEPKDVPTYVRTSLTQQIYYAWLAKDIASEVNVTAADLASLGHIQSANLPSGALFYFRAGSPKPARVRKTIVENPTAAQKGSVSTFLAAGFLAQAIANNWKLVKGQRGVRLTNNSRTVTAIVEMTNGLLYAYPMNAADFNTYGTELGLRSPLTINTETERERLVTETSNPKPGKATKELPDGSNITSFFSTPEINTVLAQGWTILSQEVVTV